LPYAAEDRFARDQAVERIYVPAIKVGAGEGEVLAGADIALAAVPEPVDGIYRAVAKACGLKAVNLCADVAAQAGELGAAMPLFGLALALDRAAPGDRILVAGFGNGADVLVFEATGSGSGAATQALKTRASCSPAIRASSTSPAHSTSIGGRAPRSTRRSPHRRCCATAATCIGFIGGRDLRRQRSVPEDADSRSPGCAGP
jgi:hydroxymethylglutaryl-CoA synthase